MGTSTLITLVAGFLFGSLMLALAAGYVNTEERRAEEQRALESRQRSGRLSDAVLPATSFFADLSAEPATSALSGFDDALLARLERHVKAEQALVTQFVHHPSIDSLYRQERVSLRPN